MAQDYYTSVASNSWIAPTVGAIGTAAKTTRDYIKG